ncbi:MAG: thiamine pyrophosphate-binding protein [Patescibacteria group bacterium]
MKLSDYVVQHLADRKVKKVFLITGGAIAHVVDSFRNIKGIDYVCHQNEQGAAMAAEAYSRLSGTIGVAMATSGPGATNLITGMCCAWFDSIPALYITGQVNNHEQKGNTKVRQVGFQETDIVSMVKPVTKYAVMVTRPEDIRYELEKAIYIAYEGRPGPVLIDIPMDIQRADIDPKKLRSFTPPKNAGPDRDTGKRFDTKIKAAMHLMEKAKRPVIIVGGGVRLADATSQMGEFIKKTGFPVVTSWSGFDAVAFGHPLHIGQFGVYGNRGANFAVQNADFIISVGSRLDTRQTGGQPSTFAREAKRVMVDVDNAEIKKRRGYKADVEICSDAKDFLRTTNTLLKDFSGQDITDWVGRTRVWKKAYPAVLPAYYKQKGSVNSYVFAKTLSDLTPRNAVIIPDDGGNLTWIMQSFEIKDGQRLFSAFGNSPMGYSFPASIGAAYAVGPKRPVIAIIGDGSFQMNIQELQTLFLYKIPAKVFILNNHSYGIIKQFQDSLFGGRYEASSPEKGYAPPDFVAIAKAYKLKTVTIKNHQELASKIKEVLRFKEPVICDVLLDKDQKLMPKLEFGNAIEDLWPEIDRKEFAANMIVKPFKKKA